MTSNSVYCMSLDAARRSFLQGYIETAGQRLTRMSCDRNIIQRMNAMDTETKRAQRQKAEQKRKGRKRAMETGEQPETGRKRTRRVQHRESVETESLFIEETELAQGERKIQGIDELEHCTGDGKMHEMSAEENKESVQQHLLDIKTAPELLELSSDGNESGNGTKPNDQPHISVKQENLDDNEIMPAITVVKEEVVEDGAEAPGAYQDISSTNNLIEEKIVDGNVGISYILEPTTIQFNITSKRSNSSPSQSYFPNCIYKQQAAAGRVNPGREDPLSKFPLIDYCRIAMKSHHSPPDVRCAVCGSTFKLLLQSNVFPQQASSFLVHLMSHLLCPLFLCRFCNVASSTLRGVAVHLQSKHSIKSLTPQHYIDDSDKYHKQIRSLIDCSLQIGKSVMCKK